MRHALRFLAPAALAFATLSGCYQLGAGPESGYPDAALGEFLGLEEGATETYVNLDAEGNRESTVVSAIVKVDRDARGRLLRGECVNVTRGVDGSLLGSEGVAGVAAGRLTLDWSDGGRDVLLATPLRPGTRWRYTSGDLRVVAQIAAIEDVCTPAGRFEDAIKVVGVMRGPALGEESVRFHRWYVRGQGEVLSLQKYADGAVYRSYMSDHHFPLSGRTFAPPACEP